MTAPQFPKILVTGGAGYVGSVLVPRLLERGHQVKVVDLFWYGDHTLDGCPHPENLTKVKLDIRDGEALKKELVGQDAVIHLACISNDPSFELDPALGKSINYDAFEALHEGAVAAGVKRFVYASSSSVYGLKDIPDVCETTDTDPLTDYSRFKLDCEHDLLKRQDQDSMERVILRPATVCGFSPRLRLDLTVNILTIHALVNRKIKVFGGSQLRPNIHIRDMVRAYETLLDAPAEKIDGRVFNAGYENRSVEAIAHLVKETLGQEDVTIEYTPSDDLRSYHINSDRIREELGFEPQHDFADAIREIQQAHDAGRLSDPMENPLYWNIRRMQELGPELSPTP